MTHIIGIIGDMGKGKTLCASYLAWRQKYENKRMIVSNYHITIADRYMKGEEVLELLETQEELTNTLLLIDEIAAYIDSRRSSSKANLYLSHFIRHTRKLGVDLIWTQQYFDMVDKRLRQFTNELWLPQGINNDLLLIRRYKRTQYGFEEATPYYIDQCSKIFKLYDTKELISVHHKKK